jgi:protein gp37
VSQQTAIGWTDLSWNPVHGCSIVSTECQNCYAAELSLRYGQTTKPWTPANAAENVILKPHKLREPLSNSKDWRGLGAAAAAAGKTEGKLVFVNSMSDLFHEQVPDEYIAQVFGVMAVANKHTFQVLTKRPERMRQLLSSSEFIADSVDAAIDQFGATRETVGQPNWLLANVWLGVSIGKRNFVHRADLLRETPAAVRFISAEPLLGPLCEWMFCSTCSMEGPDPACDECEGAECWPLQDGLDLSGIDWLIVGGESGPEHRPMNERWVSDLRALAELYETAFFFKQDSGPKPGKRGRFVDEAAYPQQFPQPLTSRWAKA